MKLKIKFKRNYILIFGIFLFFISFLLIKAIIIPGISPNPGHLIDQVTGECNEGQVLVWSNSQTKWICINFNPPVEPEISIWLVHNNYKTLYDSNGWDYELPIVEPTAGSGKEYLGGYNMGPIKYFKFCAIQGFDELNGGESESWHVDPTSESQFDKYAWTGWGSSSSNVPRAMKCMDW